MCLLIKCPFPAVRQPYKIVAIKIWPQNIPAPSCWSKLPPSISGSSPDISIYIWGPSSFKFQVQPPFNFQTFWSWLFLAQLSFTCLIFLRVEECSQRLSTFVRLVIHPRLSYPRSSCSDFIEVGSPRGLDQSGKEQNSHQEWLIDRHGSITHKTRRGYTGRHG